MMYIISCHELRFLRFEIGVLSGDCIDGPTLLMFHIKLKTPI